jgi:hypothetical protein
MITYMQNIGAQSLRLNRHPINLKTRHSLVPLTYPTDHVIVRNDRQTRTELKHSCVTKKNVQVRPSLNNELRN